MNGCSVLTPTKPETLSTQVGTRKAWGGTQASGEGESHTQEANVAEVSYGKPVTGEPEYPRQTWEPPGGERVGWHPTNAPDKQVTNGVVEAPSEPLWWAALTHSPSSSRGLWEPKGPLIRWGELPGLVRQSQG